MKRKSLSILVPLLAAILLLGCEKMPDPPGIYFIHYGNATQCLEVAPNHVYRQVLIQDGNVLYDYTGSWEIRSDGNWGIEFNGDFIVISDKLPNTLARDMAPGRSAPFNVEKFTGATAGSDWDYVNGEKVVVLSETVFLSTDKKSNILSAQQFVKENKLPGR